MLILHGYDGVPTAARGGVVAIGNFDGVHRGHQSVLARAVGEARKAGAPAGVLTFEPHPREHFAPDAPNFRLTPLPEKLRLLAGLGLDFACVTRFDAELAGLSAQAFIERVLVAGLAVRGVVIGYDFHFGKGRIGTPALLAEEGGQRGIAVAVVEPQRAGDEAFSSTRIRALLGAGRVREAAVMLGHWWRLTGVVVTGARRGTGLGFPTANIALPGGVGLAHGIYAARVRAEGRRFGAAAYLGTRPTFDAGGPVLEVFLFDFAGDLYGKTIAVELIAHLRSDRAFPSPEALAAQIELDCRDARAALADLAADDPVGAFPLGRLTD